MDKQRILISRAIFPEVIDKLAAHFEIEDNQANEPWSQDEFVRRLANKHGVFTTSSERIDSALLGACPDLKICANMAVGYNNFDVPAMTSAKVLDSTTEAECKASYVSNEELLRTADHLVLVLPSTSESHHAIGAAELALMKPSATLINIARGGGVDDAALAHALREKRLAAAGLDVVGGEPKVHPELLTLPNVVLTPHIASASSPTRMAMAHLAADNLIGYLLQ